MQVGTKENKINRKILLFDLDGTLIDSSVSILAGLEAAFAAHKMDPKQPLMAKIIGPPLRKTLSLLSGSDDTKLLDSLSDCFKNYYDTVGFKATEVFPGIESMLKLAHHRGQVLHIATNKRLLPTRLILYHLGWEYLFTSVYTLDMYATAFPNKAAMLTGLLKEQKISAQSAAYIGDRPEDSCAADANGILFYAAQWGYSVFPPNESSTHWVSANTPDDLPCNYSPPA